MTVDRAAAAAVARLEARLRAEGRRLRDLDGPTLRMHVAAVMVGRSHHTHAGVRGRIERLRRQPAMDRDGGYGSHLAAVSRATLTAWPVLWEYPARWGVWIERGGVLAADVAPLLALTERLSHARVAVVAHNHRHRLERSRRAVALSPGLPGRRRASIAPWEPGARACAHCTPWPAGPVAPATCCGRTA